VRLSVLFLCLSCPLEFVCDGHFFVLAALLLLLLLLLWVVVLVVAVLHGAVSSGLERYD
jgi:hypothetical protein